MSLANDRPGCQARQVSDELQCGKCGLTWDVNDPDPPSCVGVMPPITTELDRLGDTYTWRPSLDARTRPGHPTPGADAERNEQIERQTVDGILKDLDK